MPSTNTPVFKFLATIVRDPAARPPVGKHCPEALKSLLHEMWHVDPGRRLSMDAVVYRVGQLRETAKDVFGTDGDDADRHTTPYHTPR